MSRSLSVEKSEVLEPVIEEADTLANNTKSREKAELEAIELFSKFTADIIKEDVIFTR